MTDKIKPRIIKNAKRKCGHPFQPTFDVTQIGEDGDLHVTSYCLWCMMEKLGIKPCAKCIIPKGMKDPSEIMWIFNE